jgi:hypothetical protein
MWKDSSLRCAAVSITGVGDNLSNCSTGRLGVGWLVGVFFEEAGVIDWPFNHRLKPRSETKSLLKQVDISLKVDYRLFFQGSYTG